MHHYLQPILRQGEDNLIMRTRRQGALEGGFTLLEVLISLAILTGVIVTIITVMNSHIAASTRLSETSDAALIAREKLSEALLLGVPKTGGGEVPGMQGYRLEYTSEEAEAGLQRVCAKVGWGKDEKVAVCAYAAKD